MGWNPFDDIKDAFQDTFQAVGDFFTDPLGALEDAFNSTLDIMTFGTWSYVKDKISGYIAGLIPEQTYQDRQRTVRSSTEPKTIIYGKIRTGGQIVYIEDQGKDNVILWICFVLAGHEVEEIETVYANEKIVATSNGPGVNGVMVRPSNNPFGDNILCWSIHGNRYSAFIPSVNVDYSDDSYDGTFTPPNWDNEHRLTYQSYVWVNLVFDKDTFGDSGLPSFKFDVRGKNDIYDPRNSTYGYSDNQGLIMLDVIRSDRLFNESLSNIDLDSFSDAADIADELVASGIGATEKRYTVNGSFKLQAVPLEVLQSVATAGASTPYFDLASGQWRVTPGAYVAPVMSLDEGDLVGGLSFQLGPSKNSRHNVAKGTYIDPSQNYEAVGFRELYINQYVTDDLEELEKSYDFPFTDSGTMARRLAKIDIERNRYGISCKAVFKFKVLRLTPGDRVELTIERLGWSPKIFRVESVEVSFESGVALDLREDAPEIYQWEEGDALALDPPPALSIPNGVGVTAPSDMTFSEELYRTLTRSAVRVRLTLDWPDAPSARAYDVQYRLAGSATWIDAATYWQNNSLELPDVQDEPYEFRIRSINGIGTKSAWSQFSYTVIGKSAPPPDVPLLFVEKRTLKWNYPDSPVDFYGFLVRFQNGDRRVWLDATPAHEGIITETLFDVSEFSGTKTFLVKAVDTTGNVSENAAVLAQGLGDAPVENVIQTQNEAPAWTSAPEDYEFSVRSGGSTEAFSVTFGGVDERLIVTSAASFTGAFVNVDGYLEGAEIGSFYGDSGSLFYSPDETVGFYSSEYERIEYEWTFEVLASDVGASLTVDAVLSNGFNQSITYTPPNYTGSPLAFPGVVNADEGIYQFTFVIPQQQLPSPPIVEDIITRLDVGDINERLGDVVLSAGGTRLPIARNYRAITVVNLTLQDDGGTAESIKIIDKDQVLGPLVQAFDGSGTGVSATIDALIQGY